MATKTVDISGIGPATLTKRRGNTNIRMSFARDGGLRISLPYWLPYQAGVEFAKARASWIEAHRPKLRAQLHDGDRIGKAHRLEFVADGLARKPTVRTSQLKILVTHPMTSLLTDETVQQAAERGALKALKKQADRLLPGRLSELAEKHGFTYASVSTKRLSSRWGSCSQAKEIILNTYLMQLPWHLIDYVLIHELVHTEHLDHSEAFWRRFEQALPGAKKRRQELKTHQTVVQPSLGFDTGTPLSTLS